MLEQFEDNYNDNFTLNMAKDSKLDSYRKKKNISKNKYYEKYINIEHIKIDENLLKDEKVLNLESPINKEL